MREIKITDILTNPDAWEGTEGLQAIQNNHPRAYHNAIAHLSLWAIHSPKYSQVTITNDGKDGDLVAYYGDGNKQTYAIGAVWRGGIYSFHS